MVILCGDPEEPLKRQHTSRDPDIAQFRDYYQRKANVKREIGHPADEALPAIATDEDYPATEINADYSEAIEGV